jgi:hypothetical protein
VSSSRGVSVVVLSEYGESAWTSVLMSGSKNTSPVWTTLPPL